MSAERKKFVGSVAERVQALFLRRPCGHDRVI